MLVQAPSPTRSSGAAGAQHARPALRLKQGDGNVAPLRRGRAVAVGGIGDGRVVEGCQLVAATDLADTAWWIPAAAVWRDAACEDGACPEDGHSTERPNAIGLATARTTATAVLAGLSDRLGWEAVIALDRGDDIPALTEDGLVDEAGLDPSELVVLDGRIGHGVPTVIVLGADVARWGAGRTWAAALRRALFGRHGTAADDPGELAWLGDRLARDGLRPAYVDIGNPALRAQGVTRASVQLMRA